MYRSYSYFFFEALAIHLLASSAKASLVSVMPTSSLVLLLALNFLRLAELRSARSSYMAESS